MLEKYQGKVRYQEKLGNSANAREYPSNIGKMFVVVSSIYEFPSMLKILARTHILPIMILLVFILHY